MSSPAFVLTSCPPLRLSHRTSFTSAKSMRTLNQPVKRSVSPFQIRASDANPNLQDAQQSSDPLNSTQPPSPQHPAFSSNIRKILAALSALGLMETTYLTFNKLFSSPGAICATQGCLDVLSGPFSSFLGIPLTLFGMLAYAAFIYLSIWPLIAKEEEVLISDDSPETVMHTAAQVYATRDAATRPLMLALSCAMTVFSTYLMAILIFVIDSMCPYCVFSAVISSSIFVITAFVGRAVPSPVNALKIGGSATFLASLGAAALFFLAMPTQLLAQAPSEPQAPPAITKNSTKDTMRIGAKLGEKNTKMYGAFWCSHCYDQKQRFGKKAFSKIEYVECDKHGVNSKYQLCRDKRIPGYPTWEINGELYPGEILIEELERLVDEAGK